MWFFSDKNSVEISSFLQNNKIYLSFFNGKKNSFDYFFLICYYFLYGGDEIIGNGQGDRDNLPPSLQLPLFWYVCSLGSIFNLYGEWLCTFEMWLGEPPNFTCAWSKSGKWSVALFYLETLEIRLFRLLPKIAWTWFPSMLLKHQNTSVEISISECLNEGN